MRARSSHEDAIIPRGFACLGSAHYALPFSIRTSAYKLGTRNAVSSLAYAEK